MTFSGRCWANPESEQAREGFAPVLGSLNWNQKDVATPPSPTGPVNGTAMTVAPTQASATVQGQATPPAVVGPGASLLPKPVDGKRVSDAANQLFMAMDGWGTNEEALLGALRGKSPAELRAIKAEYQDHFGRNLESDIRAELGGKDLEEALAALSEDPVKAVVEALDNAFSSGVFGRSADKTKIQSVLEGIRDPKLRKDVIDAYEQKTGVRLDMMLIRNLDGEDRALSLALLDGKGNGADANAIRLYQALHSGFLGLGDEDEAVYMVLESCNSEDEGKALAAAYAKKTQETTQETLQQALENRFIGPALDVANCLLRGDKVGANAARVQAAAHKFWGADKEAIYKSMEGKSQEERAQLIERYNQKYGDEKKGENFDTMLKSAMGNGLDLEKAKQLQASGKMSDEFAIKYATQGLGTREELIKKTLEGKSRDEIKTLRATYLAKYGEDLDEVLNSETSGRDGFEIKMLMRGNAGTEEEKIARSNEVYDFERGSGSNWFSRGFTDLLSDSGKVLDFQHQRINQLDDGAGTDGQFTDAQKARLATLLSYQQQDVKNYQVAKDSATNTLAISTSLLIGAVITAASAGTASPALWAALSALLPGMGSMGVKAAMQGGGYALEDIGIDALTTLAGTGSASLVKLPGMTNALNKLAGISDPAAATVLQAALKSGLSGTIQSGINNTAAGLLNEDNYRGDTLDFLKGMGTQVGSGIARSALANSVSSGVVNRLGSGPQAQLPYFWNALKGGVGDATWAAVSTLANPNTYKGRGAEDVLGSVLKNALLYGVTGAKGGAGGAGRLAAQQNQVAEKAVVLERAVPNAAPGQSAPALPAALPTSQEKLGDDHAARVQD